MQNPKAKRLAALRRKLASALKRAKHAQACIAELSFMDSDTLEEIERELSGALNDLQAIASH